MIGDNGRLSRVKESELGGDLIRGAREITSAMYILDLSKIPLLLDILYLYIHS